ncbi:MAG: hypothetical protein KAI17_14050, partial [Thiotrichaceae bacterium]|nr:hypothetical protein [Thiotrichaceae bacterium]
MSEHLKKHANKKQYYALLKQLKQCYLYDQFAIKKHLHKADYLSCEARIKKSIAKVEQRKKFLPKPAFPEQLPVSQKLLEIQLLMQKHQVIVIAG